MLTDVKGGHLWQYHQRGSYNPEYIIIGYGTEEEENVILAK